MNRFLLFNDGVEEAFDFYRSVFGSAFGPILPVKGVPDLERGIAKAKRSDSERAVRIASAPESLGKIRIGDNFSVSFEAETKRSAELVFAGLARGGFVKMPLGDTFWGAYYGMIEDRFGILWMVSYTYPPLSAS